MDSDILDYDQIAKILPHRYPFLLVDRVVSLTDTSIRAYKNVSANEPFFVGHFPDFPVMPGVLQVEALAQAAGILAHHVSKTGEGNAKAFLTSIERAKFRRMVRPGDKLDLVVELKAMRRTLIKAKGQAFVNGELACEAEIGAVIQK